MRYAIMLLLLTAFAPAQSPPVIDTPSSTWCARTQLLRDSVVVRYDKPCAIKRAYYTMVGEVDGANIVHLAAVQVMRLTSRTLAIPPALRGIPFEVHLQVELGGQVFFSKLTEL